MELEGKSGPLWNFCPFRKVCAFGMYYKACIIIIVYIMCTMRTSFLLNFVSLGDQGVPTEPLIRKGTFKGISKVFNI